MFARIGKCTRIGSHVTVYHTIKMCCEDTSGMSHFRSCMVYLLSYSGLNEVMQSSQRDDGDHAGVRLRFYVPHFQCCMVYLLVILRVASDDTVGSELHEIRFTCHIFRFICLSASHSQSCMR
jgi:hypothetical protein